MIRRIFLLSLLFMTIGCNGRGCALLSNNIVCLGDSVTAGYDSNISYVDYLGMTNRDHFNERGVPGDDAVGGWKRFYLDVFPKTPHTVIIMFGLNDMRGSRTRMRNALMSMVSESYALGYRVILCTPSPHMEQNEKLATYADTIRNVASFMNTDLADVHAEFPADWQYMATVNHPNPRGHQIIANVIDRELNK